MKSFDKDKTLDPESITAISGVYADLQAKIKKLEEERATIKRVMFDYFDQTIGKDAGGYVDCGDGYKFAREERVSRSIDEMKLEETLGPELWKKVSVSTRHLDETKLKKAVANDVVKKATVKKCIVERKTFAFTHPAIKPEGDPED